QRVVPVVAVDSVVELVADEVERGGGGRVGRFQDLDLGAGVERIGGAGLHPVGGALTDRLGHHVGGIVDDIGVVAAEAPHRVDAAGAVDEVGAIVAVDGVGEVVAVEVYGGVFGLVEVFLLADLPVGERIAH